jgi:hypothetical protein
MATVQAAGFVNASGAAYLTSPMATVFAMGRVETPTRFSDFLLQHRR